MDDPLSLFMSISWHTQAFVHKRFIYFDSMHIIQDETVFLKCLLNGWDGTNAHNLWITANDIMQHDACQALEVFVHDGFFFFLGVGYAHKWHFCGKYALGMCGGPILLTANRIKRHNRPD